MTTSNSRTVIRYGYAAAMLAAFLGLAVVARAAGDDKEKGKDKAPKPAATKPAPSKPAESPRGGETRGTGGGPAAHGPTSYGQVNRGPSENGSGARTTTSATVGAQHTENTPNSGGRGNATTVGIPRPDNTRNTGGRVNSVPEGAPRSENNFNRPGNFNRSPIGAVAPRGSTERSVRTGAVIRTRPNGRVSDLHDPERGLTVHHGLNGNRSVIVERPDRSRIFAVRGRPGYLEHPYLFHGRDFTQRTFVDHGRVYVHIYQEFRYRGLYLRAYSPRFFFSVGFYGWAYNPWIRPVPIAIGFVGSPWGLYYGYYFQPEPVYVAAPVYLADYVIATDLQAAYAAQQSGEVDGAPQAADGPPVLTPEIKRQIADEVRNQLALENQEAQQNAQGIAPDPGSSGIARMLSDGRPHVFVVDNPLDVTTSSQAECSLSDGDVLELDGAPAPDATSAMLTVLSSKGGQECPRSSTVNVQLTDLQEMQNSLRATIDQGLQSLQAKQGTDGIPPVPPSAQGQPAPAQYASLAPPPDPNAGKEIQQQTQQANQAEQQALSQPPQDPGASDAGAQALPPDSSAQTAPPSVSLGMTMDQVKAALGTPTSIANLGAKAIYNYNGMKVIFQDGVVSDVQ